MPLILGASAVTTVAQGNSCRFNDGDSPYMYRTPSTTNRKTWTYSAWIKRSNLSSRGGLVNVNGGSNPYHYIEFVATNAIRIEDYDGGTDTDLITSAYYQDVGAWYHVVLAYDTTQATDTNRIKLYVNGSQVTAFSTETYCAQDFQTELNNSVQVDIGREQSNYFDGYMAEVCFVDGTQYAASDFGEFDADSPTIWKPKDVSGLTFGTNGWYMDFKDSADLGADAAGSNDHTISGIAAVDQCTDSPTNNFCTMNPLIYSDAGYVYAEGNLSLTISSVANTTEGTLGMGGGKWYWEMKNTAGPNMAIGVEDNSLITTTVGDPTSNSTGRYFVDSNGTNGNYYYNGSSTATSGFAITTDDIVSVAYDADTGKIYFAKNGVWWDSADPAAGSGQAMTAAASSSIVPFAGSQSASSRTMVFNFGNPPYTLTSAENDENGYGQFEYAPPTGFLALCTKNLGSDGG